MLRTRIAIPLRISRSNAVSRLFSSPSAPRFGASAAQMVEEEPEAEIASSSSRTRLSPVYDYGPRQFLSLPNILPPDAMADHSHQQHDLYPTTGVLNQTSMIGICLRRKEHIPRAYQIFRNILSDHEAGTRPCPDADIFGAVIEGIGLLGEEGSPHAHVWRIRANKALQKWEELQNSQPLHAALGNNGISVYRGFFSGLFLSKGKLDPLLPYFSNGTLKVRELMAGIRPADVEKALDALTAMAKQHKMEGLESETQEAQGLKEEERKKAAREVIPEIKPIMESESKVNLPASASPTPNEPDTIRFAVSNIRKALEPISTVASPIIRQRALEDSALEAAHEELLRSHSTRQAATDKSSLLSRHALQAWMYEWLQVLQEKLRTDIAVMGERVGEEAQQSLDPEVDLKLRNPRFAHLESKKVQEDSLYLYLSILPPEKLALITILEAMRTIGSSGIIDGMKTVKGIINIGKAVETEYQAETIRNLGGMDSKAWQNSLNPTTQMPVSHLITSAWRKIGTDVQEAQTRPGEVDWSQVWTPEWSMQKQIDVGGYLFAALIDSAKVARTAIHPKTGKEVTEQQPAFAHTYEYVKGRKLGVVRINPVVAERMTHDRIPTMVSPKHLPMLVEPRPWTSHNVGGYLTSKSHLMRSKDAPEQVSYLKAAVKAKTAEPILHALDVLSATPWKINRGVFDVMIESWNKGEAIANMPATQVADEKDDVEIPNAEDIRARSDYIQQQRHKLLNRRKDHGERCKINYTLEVARAFLFDTFFLPHNMDFRGRAYPLPPHLSPVGDDFNRGLLLFAEGRPLGTTGLRWLQIHLANVYGYDKMSFDERARFAEDHMTDIFDSADKPLDGKRWWLQAGDPWQCLATCKELAAALRSPNPEEFVSNLPVHQDGTCNGMQHYAALGGDVRGARAVNLENGDRPADIYTRVVDIVNKVIITDREAGVEAAQLIKEPLTRKIVKQTVMTTVYGVTFVGARDQIAKQLANRTDIDPRNHFLVSGYLARTVLSCIGDLFAGARDIQDWLSASARLISRSIPGDRLEAATQQVMVGGGPTAKKGPKLANRILKELMTAVIWTTPLGLPVVQPYRKAAKKQIMTALQTVYVTDPHQPTEVSTIKQSAAFPPNFVHSLDATHMYLTALQCKQHNISFAAVHDSYWTHASTVNDMSDLIRTSFIHLHSQNLIGELRSEFIERYGENYIPIANAKSIAMSTRMRQAKEIERRAKVRAVMHEGDLAEEDPSDLDPAEPITANLVNAEIEVMGEDPAISDEPESTSTSNEPAGISPDEIKKLRGGDPKKSPEGLEGLEIHELNGYRFVQVKDLLPPTPPKGSFDVQKVIDSLYFFS